MIRLPVEHAARERASRMGSTTALARVDLGLDIPAFHIGGGAAERRPDALVE
jgi:hypothetical protein